MAEAKTGSRIFLLSSLALGVLAMAAAFVFLQSTAGKESGPTAKILVAQRDLRENAVLDPDRDLAELAVPRNMTMTALIARALDPEFRATYKGQRVNRPLQAGQVVMKADLAAGGVLELHGDMRAMSVQVKGANGLGGMLVPGDYVRLMVTRPLPPRRYSPSTQPAVEPVEPQSTQEFTTVTIPTTFRVLAVNNQMSRSRSQVTAAEAYQSASESIANPTVTLEVTEADATSILRESGAGKFPLTLLLCPTPQSPAVR